MKKIFSLTVALITAMLSISLLPPPLTSDARAVTSITISTIRNSCIVNNANIAVQNLNNTPLDAINNWWGMPIGASDQNRSGGDLIGTNILSQPHLTTIPPNCDLSDANWIPFNEQELQFAINSNLPYLNGLDFALLDIIKGQGAKFTLVAKPIYGGKSGEAFITITPAPDGSFIRIMLDISQLPTDPNLSKIAICELMPLFMNSLQHVQNKFTNPSQMLEQMVVMDSALMLLFSPPTEITPEPTPEFVMNYDASCLSDLVVTNQNAEATAAPDDSDSLNLVTIPPLEGEFIELESLQQQAQPLFLMVDINTDDSTLSVCDPNILSDCNLRGAITRANSDSSNHYVIRIPNNTYSLNGTLTLSGHITLVGEDFYIQPQQARAIIQPGGSGMTGSLFSITDADVTLYNLTFNNGVNGMLIRGSKVTIYHSRFENNSASVNGGAIFITSPNTSYLQVIDTIFTQNTAQFGGAISINADAQTSNLSINCSTFDENVAEYGGVIFTSTTAQIIGEIRYSNFDDNRAIYSGGAIHSQVNSGIQIRWSYATSPTFSGFANYQAPNSIINAPMAIGSYNEPVIFDPSISECSVPPPPTQVSTGIPPQIAGCLDTNRDPIAEKDAIIADCIVALAWYGVTADASGLTPQWASQASFARAWTPEELREVLIGVEKVADAFHLLNHEVNNAGQPYTYNKEQAKAVFRLIIGDFYVLRVNNVLPNGPFFPVGDGDACNRTRLASCTSNIAQAITFYDTIALGVTQYTMVHEIGHRFNARSGGGNGTSSISLYGRMESARVCEEVTRDNNGNVTNWCGNPSTVRETVVFGRTRTVVDSSQRNIAINNGWEVTLDGDGYYRVQEWVRGNRGWGSGPGTPTNEEVDLVITNYQQHSFHIDDWRTPRTIQYAQTQERIDDIQLRQREVDEATADMFLNWVYRKLNPQEGFRNLSWLGSGCQSENGCDETSPPLNLFPGDRRFEWMNVNMTQIFNQTGTSWR